jgi:hypothetical protein
MCYRMKHILIVCNDPDLAWNLARILQSSSASVEIIGTSRPIIDLKTSSEHVLIKRGMTLAIGAHHHPLSLRKILLSAFVAAPMARLPSPLWALERADSAMLRLRCDEPAKLPDLNEMKALMLEPPPYQEETPFWKQIGVSSKWARRQTFPGNVKKTPRR